MTTRTALKKKEEHLQNSELKTSEPKKKKSLVPEHAANLLALSSSEITAVVANDSKEASVPDNTSFLAASNTFALVDADDLSVPYSYVTLHNKGQMKKGLPTKLMKGVPILMYIEDVALFLWKTRKMTNAKFTMNIDGIFEAYKTSANKMSLKLTNVLGRRTVDVQGKVVTVQIPGNVFNSDQPATLKKGS